MVRPDASVSIIAIIAFTPASKSSCRKCARTVKQAPESKFFPHLRDSSGFSCGGCHLCEERRSTGVLKFAISVFIRSVKHPPENRFKLQCTLSSCLDFHGRMKRPQAPGTNQVLPVQAVQPVGLLTVKPRPGPGPLTSKRHI